jgi:4-amino-4-deoxy-L-arabinose transferase-like glycosyltransferase
MNIPPTDGAGAAIRPGKDSLRSDLAILVLLAAIRVVLHCLSNGQYGFHRDELQTLDDARHMDWGFVVYPPITPLVGRLELALFGTSLIGFRFFAAVAVSAVMVLAGLIARELGGARREQILAAVAVGISPVSLAQGAVLQYVAFDYLWGVAITYFVVRLLKSDDPRWWLAIGAMLGLGMETRYTMGFLALGLVGAVLLTDARRYLRSAWLWAGVAISVLLFLPNLIWQAQHHFISLEFLSHIHSRDVRLGRTRGFLLYQALLCVNVVTLFLAVLGLSFFLIRKDGQRYRLLGWTFVVTLVLFYFAKARFYYTAPLYPVLIAAGSAVRGNWLKTLRPAWARSLQTVQWSVLVLGGVAFTLLVVPVAPIGSKIWNVTAKAHDQFREEVGWDDLAQTVARVYNTLPPEERVRTGILTGNYGEGGALNLYGPALGLPHAMSLTNSFWYRGYDPREPQTVILVGFDLDEGDELFESCQVAAKNTNRFGVVNEESRDHPHILLCHNLRTPWPLYWSTHRRFG